MDKARAWFSGTAAAVAFGLIVQIAVAANARAGFFDSATARGLNVLVFFTIQSNIIVGVSSLLLAVRQERPSTSFSVLRLTGVVAITITGLVYHAVLRNLFDLESWGLVADNVLHTIVPVMAVAGWLMFGPRDRMSQRIARIAVIFPVIWLGFTLVRGEIVGFYPYPFIDVGRLGYAKVAINCVWLAILYFGVASAFVALDRWLGRVRALKAT